MRAKCAAGLAVVAMAAMLAVVSAAAGEDRTWDNGAGDNNWFSPANWDPDAAPAASDDLAILSGTPATTQTVRVDGGGAVLIDGSDTSASVGGLWMGQTGPGDLTVSGGGQLTSTYSALGGAGTATATVTGPLSTWNSTMSLDVGYGGAASLDVLDGGQVSSPLVTIGTTASGIGSVRVEGTAAASFLTAADTLTVGLLGRGELTIGHWGQVQAGSVVVGAAGGSESSLFVQEGNLVADTLHVGQVGSGEMTVSAGIVDTQDAFIGESGNAIGRVTLTGGEWHNAGTLYVGGGEGAYGGQGELDIGQYAHVYTQDCVIGASYGSSGTVSKDAIGGLSCTGRLIVGRYGTGVLNGYAYMASGGDIVLGEFAGSSGTMNIDTLTTRSVIHVGEGGKGQIYVNNGILGCKNMYLGGSPGGEGTVILDGRNARLMGTDNARWLYFQIGGGETTAVGGKGTLVLQNGAQCAPRQLVIATIGYSAGAVGELVIDGMGSQFTATTVNVGGGTNGFDTGTLPPGPAKGTVTLRNGGKLNASAVYLGGVAGGDGTLILDGAENNPGSFTSALTVGQNGHGTLILRNGASVQTGTTSGIRDIALNTGSRGTIIVEGENSNCYLRGNLTDTAGGTSVTYRALSGGGDGELIVRDAGSLDTADQLRLGNNVANHDTITVDGLGSSWSAADAVVGQRGLGDVSVLNGGDVHATNVTLGAAPGSRGTAYLEGCLDPNPPADPGGGYQYPLPLFSELVADSVVVGGRGKGEMTIGDIGKVSANLCSIAAEPGSVGSISVAGGYPWGGGLLNADILAVGGSLDNSGQEQPGGQGTFEGVAHVTTALHVMPTGRLLGGASTVGTAPANDPYSEERLHVFSDGQAYIGGQVAGEVRNDGLLFANGTEGLIDGAFTQTDTGELNFDITSAGCDTLNVTGFATLAGLLSVDVAGFSPWFGDTFDVIRCGGVIDEFAGLAVTGGDVGLDIVYGETKVWLEVTRVSPVMTRAWGDFTGDGLTDLADYTTWADSFGCAGEGLAADGNGDGLVDIADYTTWADHFGESAGDHAPPTVPEPATLALLLAGAAAMLRRRRAA